MSSDKLSDIADTHCHLDFRDFDGDREAVLERARQAGLVRILIPGIDLPSCRALLRLVQSHPELHAALGIHPNEIASMEAGALEILHELVLEAKSGETDREALGAKSSKVAAIGEIGLDYYRDRTPRDLQRRAFLAQLELATTLNLPVIIHNRQASTDLLAILADWQSGLVSSGSPLAARPGVLHSFSDDLATAQEAIRLNFFIGITGPVTFRNAPKLQQVVANLPLDRLVVETDAPFLAPQPYRGQRNEPAYVSLVAAKIATLKDLPFSQVAKITTANAGRLFLW